MTADTNLIDKTFAPADFEQRWYEHWEAPAPSARRARMRKPFTIVIPPPNVTGSLHIGHALDNTLQDVLIRWHRLQGRTRAGCVGTDHAGIATQMVVERQLAESSQGTTRQAMGRDEFLRNGVGLEGESGGTITRQLRRLGASCDWANERFTMDEGFNTAVTQVFVDAVQARACFTATSGWSTGTRKFKTAISDLEVETREVAGSFTHYPLSARRRRAPRRWPRPYRRRDDPPRDDARRHGSRGQPRRRRATNRSSAST